MLKSKSADQASKLNPNNARVRRSTKPKSKLDGVFTISESEELTPTSTSPKNNIHQFFHSTAEPFIQKNQLTFEKAEEECEKDCRTLGIVHPIKNCNWKETLSLLEDGIFERIVEYKDESNLSILVNKINAHNTWSGYLFKSSEDLIKIAQEDYAKGPLDIAYVIKVQFNPRENKSFKHLVLVQDKEYTYLHLQVPEKAPFEEQFLKGTILSYQKLENYKGFQIKPEQSITLKNTTP